MVRHACREFEPDHDAAAALLQHGLEDADEILGLSSISRSESRMMRKEPAPFTS
jgi:hypothetical protein